MGTLFNESPRNYFDIDIKHVKSECEKIKQIAENTNMSIAEVIEVYKIKTKNRSIDCYVDNGDIWDEQLAGFGELFKSFNAKIDRVIDLLETKKENED